MEFVIMLFTIAMAGISSCRSQREFVMGFPENYYESGTLTEGRIYFVNPSDTEVNVTVRTPLITTGLNNTITVQPSGRAFLTVPYSLHCSGSGYLNTGILISSDGDIIVQANSYSAIGSSAWEVPPISKLGKVHVIMMYVFSGSSVDQGPYEIMVVASRNNTSVKIELRGIWSYQLTFNGILYDQGDILEITLDRYQVAQIKCAQGTICDMTGTVVLSNQPVYVTSGAQQSSVSVFNLTDNLVSHVPPAERNGCDYIFAEIETRANSVVGFIALEDNTTINFIREDGSMVLSHVPLSAFQYKRYSLPSFQYFRVQANKPLLAMQLAKGIQDDQQENSNAFFVYLDSLEQFRSSDYTFTTMAHSGGSFTNYLQLVVPTDAISGMLLDNVSITGTWRQMNMTYVSVLNVAITDGVHHVYHTSGVPFFAMLYGHRYHDAYALAAAPTPGHDTFRPFASSLHEAIYGLTSTTASQETTATPEATTVEQNLTHFLATSQLTSDAGTATSTETSISSSTTSPISISPFSPNPENNSNIETETTISEDRSVSIIPSTIQSRPSSDQSEMQYSTGSTSLPRTELPDNYIQAMANIELDTWTFWTECTASCGNTGVRFRLMICSDVRDILCPLQLHTGNFTISYGIGAGDCGRMPCPVDGLYSAWSEWSTCAVTCGSGVEQRVRTCEKPLYGGAPCNGPAAEFRSCDAGRICKGTRIAKVFIEPMVDKRASTLTIGGFGIVLVLAVLVVAVLLDLPTLINHVKMAKDNVMHVSR